MKPPPRTRNKPGCVSGSTPDSSDKLSHNWKRSERRKLLKALTNLAQTTGGLVDIDYAVLKEQVSTRSIPQIQFYVEGLKDRVISYVCSCLDKKDQLKKPIEVWTHLASAVTGNHKDTICQAFSQMLKVASTEPCNLMNGVPAQVRKLGDKVADRHMNRTAPQLSSPGQGERPGNAAPPYVIIKTPAPTNKIPPPQQQPPNSAANSPAATCSSPAAVASFPRGKAKLPAPPPTPQLASHSVIPVKTRSNSTAKRKTVGSSVKRQTSTSSSPGVALASSATSLTPLPSAAPSSAQSSASATSNHSVGPASAPTAASPPRSGCTKKSAPTLSPRTRSVNSSVDFEKLYLYISSINQPEDQCSLSAMESAIILDLLMSLPKELSLLHCTKLKKHLLQVHQSLSSPASSEAGRDVFKDLKDSLFGQADGEDTSGQQDAAQTSESSRVKDGEKTDAADSQSSGTSNPSTQPGQEQGTGLPLLNPFLVPLHLLMRK